MTEQNAHDDERDTADLATNDVADLAAGDATDLVTDDTADLAIDDTSDLAAGDAADLATADAARSQAPAGQLTPAGRASALPLAPRPHSLQPTALRAARAGCGGSPESPVP